MKRITALIILLCISLCASAAWAEPIALQADFSAALQARYADVGAQIVNASDCGDTGMAVVRNNDRYLLSMWHRANGQWMPVLENDRAVNEHISAYLDTDDVLFLSDHSSEDISEMYCFVLRDEWVLSYVIRFDGTQDEWNAMREYHACLTDGLLYTETLMTDENDNVLTQQLPVPLPDVLTADEKKLANFDGTQPPINGAGYPTDESMTVADEILRRLFTVCAPSGYTYADGWLNDDGVQLIADKPDGTRVLLCCAMTADERIQTVESTPLPAGTVMGVENFTSTLNLGRMGYGITIGRNADSTWGAKGFLGDEWFTAGACWVSSGLLWQEAEPAIGTSPWSDITRMDWSSVPKTLSEAKTLLNTDGWATPNNPDPEERLHLRTEARKDSRSLGKFYNGTPVRVLERGKEWTKVQIGQTVGYMMTKYLLFGDDINKQPTALQSKMSVRPVTEIVWDGEAEAVKIFGDEVSRMLIVGVIEDEWYWVWEPDTDRFGRIRQSELWDGNG